jgi:hypothetical protein
VKPRVLRCRHCLLRITSAPEDGGARPSAPSALSAQEIVPCVPTALPVARRRTVDGRSGRSIVRGNHLKSNGGALADGADANIGRRSGQRKITTPRCDLAHMPHGVSRSRIAADERHTGGLGKGKAGATPITADPAAISATRLNAPARTHTRPQCASLILITEPG